MNERINGTGTGERQGALNARLQDLRREGNGQAAATIVKENIDKMAARCWRYSKAIWLANHEHASAAQEPRPGGRHRRQRRAVFHGAMAALRRSTAADLLHRVREDARHGRRPDAARPVRVSRGHLSERAVRGVDSRAVRGAERGFRFYRRNDGQWWWRSALTPKNGSARCPRSSRWRLARSSARKETEADIMAYTANKLRAQSERRLVDFDPDSERSETIVTLNPASSEKCLPSRTAFNGLPRRPGAHVGTGTHHGFKIFVSEDAAGVHQRDDRRLARARIDPNAVGDTCGSRPPRNRSRRRSRPPRMSA
jgi:hypothetical protein